MRYKFRSKGPILAIGDSEACIPIVADKVTGIVKMTTSSLMIYYICK